MLTKSITKICESEHHKR